MSRPVAFISGASSGIGKSFAEALSPDYDLLLTARNEEALKELAGVLATDTEIIAADLNEEADRHRVEARLEDCPGLSLVINNAGFGSSGSFLHSDRYRELAQLNVNITALTALCHAGLQSLRVSDAREKAIINVASVAGLLPTPDNAVYGASKAYVINLSQALHEELKGEGIKVQALCPGFTRTRFQERAGYDTRRVPEILWMEADEVVAESLSALKRNQAVCIPGVVNKSTAALLELMPRDLLRGISSFFNL